MSPSLLQIQLALGPESSISVGWQKKDVKMSAAGELKVHLFFFISKLKAHLCLIFFEHVKLFFPEKLMILLKKGDTMEAENCIIITLL